MVNPDAADLFHIRNIAKDRPMTCRHSPRSPRNRSNNLYRITFAGCDRSHALINKDPKVGLSSTWEQRRECQNAQTKLLTSNGSTLYYPEIEKETIASRRHDFCPRIPVAGT